MAVEWEILCSCSVELDQSSLDQPFTANTNSDEFVLFTNELCLEINRPNWPASLNTSNHPTRQWRCSPKVFVYRICAGHHKPFPFIQLTKFSFFCYVLAGCTGSFDGHFDLLLIYHRLFTSPLRVWHDLSCTVWDRITVWITSSKPQSTVHQEPVPQSEWQYRTSSNLFRHISHECSQDVHQHGPITPAAEFWAKHFSNLLVNCFVLSRKQVSVGPVVPQILKAVEKPTNEGRLTWLFQAFLSGSEAGARVGQHAAIGMKVHGRLEFVLLQVHSSHFFAFLHKDWVPESQDVPSVFPFWLRLKASKQLLIYHTVVRLTLGHSWSLSPSFWRVCQAVQLPTLPLVALVVANGSCLPRKSSVELEFQVLKMAS